MSHTSTATRFNATGFSRWVNSRNGRAFRLVAGVGWLAFGLVFRDHWWGAAAMSWSFFPLTAGLFDVCWISAALGGPLSSRRIRTEQAVEGAPVAR